MKRAAIIASAYTIAREILTKALYDGWAERHDTRIVGEKKVNNIVYKVAVDHPFAVEVFMDNINGKTYDFIADKVAEMLTEDYDNIEAQVSLLVDENILEDEEELRHQESLGYQFAV